MPKKTEHHAGNNIALSCSHPHADDCHTAISLAADLNLPLTACNSQEYTVLLVHTESRLELRQTGRQAPGPVFADFTSPTMRYRVLHGGGLTTIAAVAAKCSGSGGLGAI